MPKFRKKPVEIEAARCDVLVWAASHDWSALPSWVQDAYEAGDLIFLNNGINIRTLEGMMFGPLDSMLIRGVQGELYPCRFDIFEATYEVVE